MTPEVEYTFSDGCHWWLTARLWEAARGLAPTEVSLEELEADGWDFEDWLTSWDTKDADEHERRIREADLSFPIILTPEGWVADGYHRLAKAHTKGHRTILAVRLPTMPEPNGHSVSRLKKFLDKNRNLFDSNVKPEPTTRHEGI